MKEKQKSVSYLRPRDPLSFFGPDDLGQLWRDVELHLERYQEISCDWRLDKVVRLTWRPFFFLGADILAMVESCDMVVLVQL